MRHGCLIPCVLFYPLLAAWARHPGYLGWFLWSVGTQILLLNPLSTPLFAVLSWRFFSSRIPYEERQLEQFFGEDYVRYAAATPTRMLISPCSHWQRRGGTRSRPTPPPTPPRRER